MNNDIDALKELNIRIGDAENVGDSEWLAGVLAPRLAMQKANGAIEDRESFLRQVTSGGNRVSRILEPIQLYGNRAVVECVVTVGDREIHNLRLFVRREGDWKLLGWANELL